MKKTDECFLPPYVVNETDIALPQSQTYDWGNKMLNIKALHNLGLTGKGFTAAVIDTGIDTDHPDLKQAISENHNVTSETFVNTKANGHGIAVAGIIGARDNSTGILGVAPDCKIIGIKAMRENGGGSINEIVEGIELAIAKKVNVINLSLGTTADIASLKQAVEKATNAGIYVVCSAGNAGKDNSVVYPARYPVTYAVGAVNQHGDVSAFSSRGWEVDIAAPGERVLTTYTKNGYARLSGTSFSAPFVSGLILLFLESKVNLTHQILADTAIDIEEPGQDDKSGHGLIDPMKIVVEYSNGNNDDIPTGDLTVKDAYLKIGEFLKSKGIEL